MSVKIINVLKDDSFNDILELFQQTSAPEVILVLPRVGRLFRSEDHFAAFAAEAAQAGKTVSVLTANPQTAQLARKFGFGVMASGAGKKAKPATAAVLATAPAVPADYDIPSDDDTAVTGDVPVTADELPSAPAEEEEGLGSMMHIEDDAGEPVDENEDGAVDRPDADDLAVGDDAGFVAASERDVMATLAAAPKPVPARPPQPNDIDGVRIAPFRKTLAPVARSERVETVPISRAVTPEEVERADLDYIDAVWRDKNGTTAPNGVVPAQPVESLFSRTLSGTARLATHGSMPKKVALAILGAAVVVLAGVIYLMTGSAHVALTPIGKSVDTQITVQASDTFTAVDDAFAKLPGQLIEVTKTAEKTSEATGTRDVASKARGKITVYNEYSSTPQTLIATTRFQADNGKVFRTLQTITVPGSTVNAGQTVPGTTTVDVIADQPGTEYNIPAGRFVIVAFKEKGETDKVEKFYGKSEAAMSGGAAGPSKVVTQADYDQARDAAMAQVRSEIAAALEAQGAGLIVLDADKPAMASVTSSANPDDAAGSVTVSARGTIRTIAFRRQDLMDLIAGTILKKERLVVMPEQLELAYRDVAFKSDLGMLVFTVAVTGTGYLPVDTDVVKMEIAGRDATSIREYFKDRDGVQSATVTLSPFWVRKVPKNVEKISIELLYGTGQQ